MKTREKEKERQLAPISGGLSRRLHPSPREKLLLLVGSYRDASLGAEDGGRPCIRAEPF